MEAEFNMPMLLHSMGGVERSQTGMAQLERGAVVGLLASTDNHFGHPNSYGEGVAGIWCDELTRESVLDAIRRRHTWAMTGDRIGVTFNLGNAMMGDIVGLDESPTLSWRVDALGAIDYVRIIRNGAVVHDALPTATIDDPTFVLRVDFGWDAMTADTVTDWSIRIRVDGGEVTEVCPCLAGGSASVEKINAVRAVADREVALSAFTSRANVRPTSGVAFRLNGRGDTRVEVDVQADREGAPGGCSLAGTIDQLRSADAWAAISDVFSSPKIRLGLLREAREVTSIGQWTDPAPTGDDWYLLKVQQANGHAAWSSPIRRRRD
jgi:hypothetical protein